MQNALKLFIILSFINLVTYASESKLRVYTYDSLTGKDSLLEAIETAFLKVHPQAKLEIKSLGESSKILSQLARDEKSKDSSRVRADLVIGLDALHWPQAKPFADLNSIQANDLTKEIPRHFFVEDGFIPFDYGYLGFLVDLHKVKQALPTSWKDLLKPEWKKKILIQDPRTSSPGFQFLKGVSEVYPNPKERIEYLSQISKQWLTLPPSWSQSYKLFTKEEAPLIWTYFTSLAYHEKDPKTKGRYQVLNFKEGYPMQMEGVFVVKKERTLEQKKLLKTFLTLTLSESIQKLIPEKQFLLPIRAGVKLPDYYQAVPQPAPKHQRLIQAKQVEELLMDWKKALFEK